MAEPATIYRDRLTRRRSQVERLLAVERRLSWLRLAIALGAAVVGWQAVAADGVPGWVALPLPLTFVAVAVWHERLVRRRREAERGLAWYEAGCRRLDDRWEGAGAAGDEFADPEHPYTGDLDVFGRGSLFELLCRSRTSVGRAMLAGWLARAASPAGVRERQAAVRELAPRLDLREDLAVRGEDVGDDVDYAALAAWGGAPTRLADARWPLLAGLLGVTNVVTLLLWLVPLSASTPEVPLDLVQGAGPLAASAAASLALTRWLRRRAEAVLGGAGAPLRGLELLRGVLVRIEDERFETPRLAALRARLDEGSRGDAPSRRIASLHRLCEVDAWRGNMVFRPFADLVLLGTQLACAVDRWRAATGPRLATWLDVVGEIEATASLACHAWERPDDAFPEIADEGALFIGTGLGHPLLPTAGCIRNDVELGDERRVYLVSGSNMSGKSTLLRTVGVNAVLALAGAPVRASALRVGPVTLGASMRIVDSLHDGVSHFYAEIRRLRTLFDVAEREPVLFLLDEVLHGTNSHDRRIGAAAVIRGLVERGAVGLVTTHDLALARIADDLGAAGANVHFSDRIEDDRIVFDYRLREGVVRRSNALALMRAVGLEVGDTAEA